MADTSTKPEKASDAAHPYEAVVQAVRQRIARDYPDDKQPAITIEPSDAIDAYYLPIVNDPDGKLILVGEELVITQGMADALSPEQMEALVAHEMGHDVLNHARFFDGKLRHNQEMSAREHECQADHFAARYSSADAQMAMLTTQRSLRPAASQKDEPSSSHPLMADRIRALAEMTPEILGLRSEAIRFNDDCSINEINGIALTKDLAGLDKPQNQK